MRMRLVPDDTNIDFFMPRHLWLGPSSLLIASLVIVPDKGLNFGIDFQGGTTIRTQSETAVDVGAYRAAIAPLELGRCDNHRSVRPELCGRSTRRHGPHPSPRR